ncbi:PREDICTED: RNA-binding protein 39 isoform X2 [Camelina sativa]|uniref:RNA-binding protein 39 isoform X2 n=1 Tax=Camelina sativa TaxID=90675 RepID=A0ABM1RFW3_CAMSA|nr:PREDICTED: RNA-binding protein 39 isoform X2 [Camelina sativa]
MELDEYEYLEKTVEEGDVSDRKIEESGNEKSERRSYRKREGGERHDEEDVDEERGSRRSKKSRGDGEENGKRDRGEKERHRSSRDKERERDKVREGSRDKESVRERSSKERDRSDRDKTRDRERREREKERERRERRSSSRSRREEVVERGSRRHKDKKEEPEADPERDQRTVFAYQMPLKATERDVYEFFSKAGKVRDVRLIMDRNSRRSKGVGYIEFYEVTSVPMALALSEQIFLGQPVMVKSSEAEKNLAQTNSTTGGTGPADRKLYVGNLHFNMSEPELRQIFERFGPVELVQLPVDAETKQCKGFGFIQFAQLEHSKAAQIELNGKLEISGRTIKVSAVSDHIGTHDTAPKSADFDDDDGGGLALNAQSRALLMQKLDRTGIAASIVGSLGVPALNGTAYNQPGMIPSFPTAVLPTAANPSFVTEPVGQPSDCLLLKNMFDPATETDPEFDLEIREDVKEECSRYGRVSHIYVDKNSAGFVYLRFETVQGAVAAQNVMHRRWFAQKMITATFMPRDEYEAKAKD